MSNELKKFIDENRREFDDDLPSTAAWHQVERSIGANKPLKQFSIRDIYKWCAVAAVFFITATCFYFLVIHDNGKKNHAANKGTPALNNANGPNDISRMAPEYAAEAKKIYQSIENQQQQLQAMAKEQPQLYSQFADDLAALDSSYRVLKTQAVQTPNREVIIKAMLQNLQLQAELLSKQLGIIHEFKNDKTENNEKNNSPRI